MVRSSIWSARPLCAACLTSLRAWGLAPNCRSMPKSSELSPLFSSADTASYPFRCVSALSRKMLLHPSASHSSISGLRGRTISVRSSWLSSGSLAS